MEYFPEEVLLKIFDHLDIYEIHLVISSVCTRWKELASAPSLNRHIRVDSYNEWMFLKRLPTKCHLWSVRIGWSMSQQNRKICRLIDDLPNLTRLIVSRYNTVSDETIAAISERCPKLKYMDVTPEGLNPTPQLLNAIRLHETVAIRVASGRDLNWMADNCTNATEIKFLRTSYASEEMVALFKARRHHLTKLSMRNPHHDIIKNITIFRNLKELRLYVCNFLNVRILMPLVALKRLSVLHITRTSFGQKEFTKFFRALDVSQLIDLNVSGTGFCNSTAKYLADEKPPLRRIVLTGCNSGLSIKGVICLLTNVKHLNRVILDKEHFYFRKRAFHNYESIIEYHTLLPYFGLT